jgi:hypothetical protein
MRSRFATIVKVLCALLLLASPLAAQTRSEDATQVQTARVRFQEGVRFYDTKQYGKARVAFTQAYALKPHASILLNLAQSEVRSGYEADAANHFSKYLRESDKDSPTRKEAEKGLARAKKMAGEVLVKVNEEGVQILLDGKEQGLTPLDGPLYVSPGSHTLEGKRGTSTASASFDAVAGQTQEVALSMSEGQLAPFPEPAVAPSRARPEESAPPEEDSGPGRQSFGSWLMTPTGIILWGVTAAGVVTGVVALGISIDANNSAAATQANILAQWGKEYPQLVKLQGPCNPPPTKTYWNACQKYVDLRDRRNVSRTVSYVAFVGAALAALAIPIVYFTTAKRVNTADQAPKHKAHRASIDIVPLASPDFQGLALSGRF